MCPALADEWTMVDTRAFLCAFLMALVFCGVVLVQFGLDRLHSSTSVIDWWCHSRSREWATIRRVVRAAVAVGRVPTRLVA